MDVSRYKYTSRPFLFALIVLSTIVVKCLHLFLHVRSVPLLHIIWYFPTFFISDSLLWSGSWLLLHKTSGVLGILSLLAITCVAIVTLSVTSSQIGFFYVTGSEVQWGTVKAAAYDYAGLRLLLSGISPVFMSGCALAVAAWLTAPHISRLANRCASLFPTLSNSKSQENDGPIFLPGIRRKRLGRPRLWALCFVTFTIYTRLTRPPVPYNHLSSTVPFALIQIFRTEPRICAHAGPLPFPFPDLLREQYWEYPHGRFKGWAPGIRDLGELEDLVEEPTWYPDTFPTGFKRWTLATSQFEPKNNTTHAFDGRAPNWQNCSSAESIFHTYNPVTDPLRITNLDLDLLEPLRDAFLDHEIPIRHIFLIAMESARKDIFPFKKGSHLYKGILSSHDTWDPVVLNSINARLAALTPVAQQITGESSHFELPLVDMPSKVWQDTAPSGMGGMNVKGAKTASTLTFKSALASHCGVYPLPLDFMYENDAEIYQPCIMQILELFNAFKSKRSSTPTAALNRRWRSVFTQSVTAEYSNQSHLNAKMGFQESITREQIAVPSAKHYHKMEEINYFGFKEQEVFPYIRDTILDTLEMNERLFLTHFTSTTHHPWNLPSGYPKEEYWREESTVSSHEDMNNYLNTVRYVDRWLGEILSLLDDTGIANETLVVFVGDHGQAFREDARAIGTYENGHISNFDIPIVFRHPLLPRLDIAANATSISILPTILDLLINTKSLNERDTEAALDLIHEYEGQSLLRPYRTKIHGRQAWNFGIINAGGAVLSVASADVPYRLILPLNDGHSYVFANDMEDPAELQLIEDWTELDLLKQVRRVHGEQAAVWASESIRIGRWWVDEIKRIWNFHS